MSKPLATTDITSFEVVVEFPKCAFVDRIVFKMLVLAGFTDTRHLGLSHWRAAPTEENKAAADKIAEYYNTHEPVRKYRLYPKKVSV